MQTEQSLVAVETSTWEMLMQQATAIYKSGFLAKKIKSPEQAIAIILTGRELGIGTMAALNTINVIEGTPTVSPQLMLALIQRTGQVKDLEIGLTPDKKSAFCRIERKGRKPYTAIFGELEATRLGLMTKDNYKKQPQVMFQWRAIAAACRMTFADAILGLYTAEEITAGVDTGTGEVIDMSTVSDREPEGAQAAQQPQQVRQLAQATENAATTPESPAIDVTATEVTGESPEPIADAELQEIFNEQNATVPAEESVAYPATKEQVRKMGILSSKLTELGVGESEWRQVIDDATKGRTSSRARVSEDEAGEIIATFAKWLNNVMTEGKR